MQEGRRCPPIFPEKKKKTVNVYDWERRRKELLIANSLCVMRAILCNWQCDLNVKITLYLPCFFFYYLKLHCICFFSDSVIWWNPIQDCFVTFSLCSPPITPLFPPAKTESEDIVLFSFENYFFLIKTYFCRCGISITRRNDWWHDHTVKLFVDFTWSSLLGCLKIWSLNVFGKMFVNLSLFDKRCEKL